MAVRPNPVECAQLELPEFAGLFSGPFSIARRRRILGEVFSFFDVILFVDLSIFGFRRCTRRPEPFVGTGRRMATGASPLGACSQFWSCLVSFDFWAL